MAVMTYPQKTGLGTSLSLGTGTFAQMKALGVVPDGATFTVTNYGRGGSAWRYSSSLADWFPCAPVLAYENTSLITGLAQTADQVLLAMPMEAGLLAGKVFETKITLGKNGTTDAAGTLSVRMGTLGTTADTAVATAATPLAAANRSIGFDLWNRMASATSVNKLGGAPTNAFGAGASGTLVNAATAVADVTSQLTYLSLTITMAGTTDSPQLGYVGVYIHP